MMEQRRREREPMVPRKVSFTYSEDEAIQRIVAEQGTSLSRLTRDLILHPYRRMSSADARALASALMQTRETMSAMVRLVRESGEPVDQEFIDKAEDLNDRLYRLTEEQARR